MAIELGQIIRFMALRATEGLTVLLLIMFIPNIPPYCKISVPKTVTPAQSLEGKLALNERLNEVVLWHKGDLYAPESFADYNGVLYTALHNGQIVKFVGERIVPVVRLGKTCKGFHEERICGRPLGMKFDKDGSLIAADAYYGIFRVNVNTGEKTQLVSMDVEIDGKKPKLPNSIAIASNGDIFWSDSSTEFSLEDGMFDMFADGSGRLIRYDVKIGKNVVLIDNLLFANGVSLSDDEDFVLVAETGRSCVHRYYLKGPRKGSKDLFIDGLPGLPDNINSDGQGGFFLPLLTARDNYTPAPTQVLGPFPLFRKLVARLMALSKLGFTLANRVYSTEIFERAIHLIGHFSVASFMLPSRCTIVHVSKTGEIIDSLHANNRKAIAISDAHIFNGELYLGSPFNDYVGRIPLEKAGLDHLIKKQSIPDAAKEVPTQLPKETASSPTTQKPATRVTPEPTPKVVPVTEAPVTSTTAKPTTTTAKPTTTTTTAKPTTTTTAKPTTTTTTAKPTTTTTTAKPTTTTTAKPTTTTTAKPTTTTARPITTVEPTTTAKPTTTAQPTTTAKPTTAAEPTTTAQSTTATTPKPTTTSKPATTAKPPATAKPAAKTEPTTETPRTTTAKPVESPKTPPKPIPAESKSAQTGKPVETAQREKPAKASQNDIPK